MAPSTLALTTALSILLYLIAVAGAEAAISTVTAMYPTQLPANWNGTTQVGFAIPPPHPASFPVNVTGCDGYHYTTTAVPHHSGVAGVFSASVHVTWVPSCAANPRLHITVATVTAPGSFTQQIKLYLPPTYANASVANVSTTGFQIITLALAPTSPPILTTTPQVLLSCEPAGGAGPAAGTVMSRFHALQLDGTVTFLMTASGDGGQTAANSTGFEERLPATLSGDGQRLTFETRPVPTECGGMSLWASINGGAHFHATGLTLPVITLPRVKIVTLLFETLNVSWDGMHNHARIRMSSALESAVDASTYVEKALVAGDVNQNADAVQAAMVNLNATMVICTGFIAPGALARIAELGGGGKILVLSSLRPTITPPYSSVAWGSPKIYEGSFFAGYIAASVSKSGIIGIVQPTGTHSAIVAAVNAIVLGAQLAKATPGHTPATQGPLTIMSWNVGSFDNDWGDENAANNLLARGVDVLLVLSNGDAAMKACHQVGCISVGWNTDKRERLGDQVAVSVVYHFEYAYTQLAKRLVRGERFGPENFWTGFGFGLDISPLSPVVPVVVRREVERRAALARLRDGDEFVFCGNLTDTLGNARLRGGESTCLSPANITTMNNWYMAGLTYLGNYPIPPRPQPPTPQPWRMSITLQSGIMVIATVTLLFSIASTVVIIMYARVDAIKYASPIFLFIINLGAALMALTLMSFGTTWEGRNDMQCQYTMWTAGVGFVLLFGSLFAKTYRVHRLFNNRRWKRVRMDVFSVLRIIVGIVVLDLVLLCALHFVFPRRVETITLADAAGGGVIFPLCGAGKTLDGVSVLNAVQLVLLMWGAYLAFRTKDVPYGFNESRYIGVCIYNVILCDVIAWVLETQVRAIPAMQYFILLLRLGIPPMITLFLLYVPKVYAIYNRYVDSMRDEQGYFVSPKAANKVLPVARVKQGSPGADAVGKASPPPVGYTPFPAQPPKEVKAKRKRDLAVPVPSQWPANSRGEIVVGETLAGINEMGDGEGEGEDEEEAAGDGESGADVVEEGTSTRGSTSARLPFGMRSWWIFGGSSTNLIRGMTGAREGGRTAGQRVDRSAGGGGSSGDGGVVAVEAAGSGSSAVPGPLTHGATAPARPLPHAGGGHGSLAPTHQPIHPILKTHGSATSGCRGSCSGSISPPESILGAVNPTIIAGGVGGREHSGSPLHEPPVLMASSPSPGGAFPLPPHGNYPILPSTVRPPLHPKPSRLQLTGKVGVRDDGDDDEWESGHGGEGGAMTRMGHATTVGVGDATMNSVTVLNTEMPGAVSPHVGWDGPLHGGGGPCQGKTDE